MHEIRKIVNDGDKRDPVARKNRGPTPDRKPDADFANMVRREEARKTNQRHDERYMHVIETATVKFRGRYETVEILNVSSRGAMVRAKIEPKIGVRLNVRFEDCNWVESIVRWVNGDRIGLEFTNETIIIAPAKMRDLIVSGRRDRERAVGISLGHQREPRQHLLWKGVLHWNQESREVKLRNISPRGAMLTEAVDLQPYTPVVLELAGVGGIQGEVRWCRAGHIGVRFSSKFDLSLLERADPEVTGPAMVKPDYLKSETDAESPWAASWDWLRPEDLAG